MKGHPLSRIPFEINNNVSKIHTPISLNRSSKDLGMKKSKTKQGVVKSKSQKKICVYQNISNKQNAIEEIHTFGNCLSSRQKLKDTECMHNQASYRIGSLAEKAGNTQSLELSGIANLGSKPQFLNSPYPVNYQTPDRKLANIDNMGFYQFQPSDGNKQQKNIGPNSHPESIKSGYGTVYNPSSQYLEPNEKIDFSNLYNVGRYWYKFQGSFQKGDKSGPGNIYLTNGALFSGYFSEDLANGNGAVHMNGQIKIRGIWKNNKLITKF